MAQAGDPSLALPNGSEGQAVTRPRLRPSLAIPGLAVLANGVARLLHILRAAPLPAALAATWTAGLAVIVLVVARSEPRVRDQLARLAAIGIGAGIVATVLYDAAKAV